VEEETVDDEKSQGKIGVGGRLKVRMKQKRVGKEAS